MKADDYAFPAHPEQHPQSKAMGYYAPIATYGLSVRDYTAIEMMKAIIIGNRADGCVIGTSGATADAYATTDALIEESQK